MKRLLLIDLLWAGLIVLACLTWSVHDQSEYADRLNHYGLSESALIVNTKSKMTPAQAAAKLAATKLDNIQVQFQTRNPQPTVYLYAKGDYASLPVTDGTWFSDSDLRSPLSVAVVGQTQAEQLYSGSNQRYLMQNHNYIPVLGVVATRKGSQLNQALFLNASAATRAAAISALRVVADGQDIDTQTAVLKKTLGATSTSPYTYDSGSQSHSWWTENWQTVVFSTLIAIVAWLLSLVVSRLAPRAATTGLDIAMTHAFVRGWWGRTTAHAVVAGAIGLAIGWWSFYLTDHIQLVVFCLVALMIYSTGTYYGLTTRFHREEGVA
ncbi:ABC transporter permease [Lacticaseibacillus sp. GG6-2]